MAFTDLGSIASGGSTANNQTALTVATTASCSAGELVVVAVTVDNISTGGGDTLEVAGVTIGGVALTKGRQNSTNLAAQAGASVSLWWGVLAGTVASGSNIVATFIAPSTTNDASALSARHFSFASGATVAVEATNAGTATTTNPGSLNATTANLPCLRIRAIGCEYDSTQTLTVTASWTAWAEGASAATGTITEQVIEAEHRISTGTGDASAPTLGAACDSASVYVAFKEVFTLAAAGGSFALTGSAAALTETATSAPVPAGLANIFNPWGSRRLPPDRAWPNSLLYAAQGTTFAGAAGSYSLTGSAAGLTVGTVDTTNLPAGGANWFNPWGRRQPQRTWTQAGIRLTPAVTLGAAGSYTLTGASAALTVSGVTVNMPAGMTGGYVPWRRPPRQDWIWSVAYTAAVPGGVTLSAGAGSYTLSGSAAGLTATTVQYIFRPPLIRRLWSPSRWVAVNAQNWVKRNQFVGFVRLSADAGSHAITGSSAALALRLTANSGAHSVSAGSAAVLARGFAAGASAYAITGTAAQTIQAGITTLVCGTGSYAITGSSSALALGLTANSGSYAVSAGSAAVLARGFAAGASAYAITGTAAQTIQAGTTTLACGTGSYAITGSSSALAFRLTANAGAHAVSAGSAAVLARGFAAAAGAYAITGTAAALTASSAGLSRPTPPERRFKIATENRAAMVPAATVVGKVSEDQRMAFVE